MRATRWILGLLVLAAVVVLVRALGQEQRFVAIARRAEPWWLALAVVLQIATYVALAGAWRSAIERGDRGERAPPLFTLVRLALVELFLDQAIPSAGLVGTFFLATALRRRGVGAPAAAGAVGTGLFGFYVAQLVVVIAATLSLVLRRCFIHVAATIALVSLVAAIAIPAGMATAMRGAGAVAARLQRFGPAERIHRALQAAPRELLFAPGTILVVASMRLLLFALDAATLGACLAAVGEPRPFDEMVAAVALASTAGSISFLPGGVGSFEAVATGILAIFGVSLEAAAAAVLLMRGLAFWLPMLPGFLLARHELGNGAGPRARDTLDA